MLQRVLNKIQKDAKNKSWNTVPAQSAITYFEKGNQWYEPVLAGPSTFAENCTSAKTARGVLETFKKLERDRYLDFLINYFEKGLTAFGDSWKYADINTVLYGICRSLPINSYLEIGVRRGRSMSMVASQHPHCYIAGFDMWIENYAGMENPGPDFVTQQLAQLGYKGTLDFFNGDSKKTIPDYFSKNPNQYFDLITVDGDHSAFGAKTDLVNTLKHLKIGGVLVFDDICSYEHPYLAQVWQKCVANNKQYATFEYTELGLGVAFAIKRY